MLVPFDENTPCFRHLAFVTLGFLYVKNNYAFSLYVAAYILVHLMRSLYETVSEIFLWHEGKVLFPYSQTIIFSVLVILFTNALCCLRKSKKILICAQNNKPSTYT